MSSLDAGHAISAALDTVLMPAGFAGGQHGIEEQDAASQTIFCAGHDEFSDRHPWLPQANSQPRGAGACTDLIVETTGDGRLGSVQLEDLSLEQTLRMVAHADDAEAVGRITGAPQAQALPVLRAALSRLFVAPR